jgi:signal transduction histidine kinase
LNSIDELEKRLEEKIEQINKLEKVAKMQEEFFSYMAHEFKTPLTITYSAIQLLDYLCKEEISDRAKGFINKIRQSTLQQLRLVNNIMDISRADSGYLKLNRKNFDIVLLTKVIVNSVTSITKGKGINIIFTSSIPSKYIFIDDEKYERILLNLLSNAIKFTQAGKSIYVDLYVDDKVNIKVKDEGIGIPKDKGKIIFDRFGQINNGLIRNTEGTGIGLCLTKILANALGGDITFESEEGNGSEFTVQLPIISVANPIKDKIVNESIEDRLIQSINLEFSNIYL